MNKMPVPSTLLFVSQLPGRPQGDKVRFLGCVEQYIEKDGVLELFHHFPKRREGTFRVLVDINSILDSVRKDQLETGAWINVVAYIAPPSRLVVRTGQPEFPLPAVQAIMIWSADSINVSEYEKAIVERQKFAS